MAVMGWGANDYLLATDWSTSLENISWMCWIYVPSSVSLVSEPIFNLGQVGTNNHRRTLRFLSGNLMAESRGASWHNQMRLNAAMTKGEWVLIMGAHQRSSANVGNVTTLMGSTHANSGINQSGSQANAPNAVSVGRFLTGEAFLPPEIGLAELSVWERPANSPHLLGLDAQVPDGDGKAPNALQLNETEGKVYTGRLLHYWPLVTLNATTELSGSGLDLEEQGEGLSDFAASGADPNPPVDFPALPPAAGGGRSFLRRMSMWTR